MKILQCLHTAILVADIERSIAFYEGILGLERVDRSLKYSGIWYAIGNYQIHLIEDKNYRPTRQNPDKWGRNPHIALAVPDIEGTKDYLLSLGIELQSSASGRAALFISDPDGNIIEIAGSV